MQWHPVIQRRNRFQCSSMSVIISKSSARRRTGCRGARPFSVPDYKIITSVRTTARASGRNSSFLILLSTCCSERTRNVFDGQPAENNACLPSSSPPTRQRAMPVPNGRPDMCCCGTLWNLVLTHWREMAESRTIIDASAVQERC